MSITIRRAEPSDAPAVARIFGQPSVIAGTLQLPFPSLREWEKRLEGSDSVQVLVAETADGAVVGTIHLVQPRHARRKHTGGIGMAVDEAYQGQGVGRQLLAQVLDLADNWLGLTRVELTVFADNAHAIRLYVRCGFEEEGRLKQYAMRHGELVDVLMMARLS